MATADDLRRLALALDGTGEAPHFDRVAFKSRRIYATLAADGLTANLRLSPEEQELRCTILPDAFAAVPNAWGAQGWTTARLAALGVDDLAGALRSAWAWAQVKPGKNR